MEFTPEALKKTVEIINGDGHTIFKPEAFLEAGLPREFVDKFTQTHESDRHNPKEMIFNKAGEVLMFSTGVYGLDLILGICRTLDLPLNQALMGRGFRARNACEALTKYLEEQGK
jgi:hypothetical protein